MYLPRIPRRRLLSTVSGFTLVEVAVAVALGGFLLLAVLNLFATGLRTERLATARYERARAWLQAEAHMLDGPTGLRAASEITVAPDGRAFAFLVDDQCVTYRYQSDRKTLTRYVQDPATAAAISSQPGEVVLDGLEGFSATLDGSTLTLQADFGREFAPATRVRLRNLAP